MKKDKEVTISKTMLAAAMVIVLLLIIIAVMGGMLLGQKKSSQDSGKENLTEAATESASEDTKEEEPDAKREMSAEEVKRAASAGTAAEKKENTENNGNYDIASNLVGRLSDGTAFIQSDHFYLAYNYDDFANGLWGCEAVSSTMLKFYYSKAKDAGYGGVVFWLEAYDWGDNSYEVLPDYAIAGLSKDKKYIVSFPTDVQFNPSDRTQMKEYNRLSQFARKIKDGNTDNPFTVGQ